MIRAAISSLLVFGRFHTLDFPSPLPLVRTRPTTFSPASFCQTAVLAVEAQVDGLRSPPSVRGTLAKGMPRQQTCFPQAA